MSHIPNSAMPHAGGPQDENKAKKSGGGKEKGAGASISKAASKVADSARENPKTAIAAGVAVVGAIAAAAAIPAVRGRKKSGEESGGGAKKSSGSKSGGTKSGATKSGSSAKSSGKSE